MIVTIDGPAGAGKSHVARALAKQLGFGFLDTGAMYRIVALASIRQGVYWSDSEWLERLATEVSIEMKDNSVLLDGEDVSDEIRTSQVTSVVHHVADNQGVRQQLGRLQRAIAGTGDFVTEGRDQGTVVFPEADCKIFLTASPGERARRRQRDLAARGESASIDEVLSQQNERDLRDQTRPVGALKRADDAIEVITDGLTQDNVVEKLETIVRDKM